MDDKKCVILAVCGSSGSGKSTFTLALGEALSKLKKKVICISADCVCPSLAFWLPDMVPAPGITKSLGALLQYENPDLESVARCLISHPKYSDLALMGMEYGCYPGRYDTSSIKNCNTLLDLLRREVDYIIVDCLSDIKRDTLSEMAFSSANCIICMLTPNCKGLAWMEMMKSENLSLDECAFILSPITRESPISALKERIPQITLYLPYSEEVELCVTSGKSLTDFEKQSGKYYGDSIKNFALSLIQNENVEDRS